MRRLYGVGGLRFLMKLAAVQVACAAGACALWILNLAQIRLAPAPSVWLSVTLVWCVAALSLLMMMWFWQSVDEQLMRFDVFRRGWHSDTGRVLRLSAWIALLSVGVAISMAVLSVPAPTAAVPLLAALAYLGTAACLEGVWIFSECRFNLNRRLGFARTWNQILEKIDSSRSSKELDRVRLFVAAESGQAVFSSIPELETQNHTRGPIGADIAHALRTRAQRGFHYPGITAKPVHSTQSVSWIKLLESRTDEIRQEFLAIAGAQTFVPYPLVENQQWLSFSIYKGGVRIDDNADRLPKTTELIETIVPGGRVKDALISVLDPGGYLAPHLDHCIPLLTFHLPLIVPAGCGIRVGNELIMWEEGRGVIIDPTFEHEAWNLSDRHRVNLLVDFWHPELNEAEREFFSEHYEWQMRPQLDKLK